jgi:hypothetical protein
VTIFGIQHDRIGRSSLTPGRAARRPGHLRGRIQKNSQPSPAARVVTGPGSYALLTLVALMGAADGRQFPVSLHTTEVRSRVRSRVAGQTGQGCPPVSDSD